jgi:hypothetical protein
MLPYLVLLLVLVIPVIFWVYGKKMLGNQTHPAASFFLAWMVCVMALGAYVHQASVVAAIWVGLNFAVLALAGKWKSRKLKNKNSVE